MSFNKPKIDIVPSVVNNESHTNQQDNSYDRKRQNRKGKGAQERSNEKFRLKKNQETAKEQEDELASYLDQLRLNVKKAFGSSIPPSVTKPSVEVKPSTYVLPQLCEKVVDVLDSAGKIRFDQELSKDDAKQALQTVSAAQLEAKLYFARLGSKFLHPWEVGPVYHQKMHYYASLNRNFSPIVGFLDQIGKFKIDGQEFYPWNPNNEKAYRENIFSVRAIEMVMSQDVVHATEKLLQHTSFMLSDRLENPPGLCFELSPTQLGPHGRPMVFKIIHQPEAIRLGIINEQLQLVHYTLAPGVAEYAEKVMRSRPFDFNQQVLNYQELIKRSARKFRSALPEVDITSGKGTQAQLVGSEEDHRHHFKRAWCNREVGTDVLTVGCVFELAPYSRTRQYPLYNPDIAVVETDVQSRIALSHYIDTIHGEFASDG